MIVKLVERNNWSGIEIAMSREEASDFVKFMRHAVNAWTYRKKLSQPPMATQVAAEKIERILEESRLKAEKEQE